MNKGRMMAIDLNLEMGRIMMNKLEEEDNKRKTLRKHKEKQETREGTKLNKLKARKSSRNCLAIVPLVKGSRKNENHKGAL